MIRRKINSTARLVNHACSLRPIIYSVNVLIKAISVQVDVWHSAWVARVGGMSILAPNYAVLIKKLIWVSMLIRIIELETDFHRYDP